MGVFFPIDVQRVSTRRQLVCTKFIRFKPCFHGKQAARRLAQTLFEHAAITRCQGHAAFYVRLYMCCFFGFFCHALFTVRVFVVDNQPTHVFFSLCVFAGSSGSALSHSA